MKRYKHLLGIVAVVALIAGGVWGINQASACDGCAAHAQKTTDKVDATQADAKVEKANATTVSAGCCASGKTASAKQVNAGATCNYSAKSTTASAQCTEAAKASYAKADGELLSAEATLAKLAHCGIDCRTVDADMLAGKLADGSCGSYTEAQWTTMIKSAQALDAKESDAMFASATSGELCTGDSCPMNLVAADLAEESTNN